MLVLALVTAAMQALPSPWTAGPQNLQTTLGPDSARLVRLLRSDQASFERFRRGRLPQSDGTASGTCDVRIGRYCYWRDDDDDTPPPPEAGEIVARRNSLISELESAARTLPGDEWIAGQAVRYLVEANRTDDAWRYATTECESSRSWCMALAGYAAHAAQRYANADSAFSVALAAMDTAERCRWLDASSLLDGDLERQFNNLDCEGRARFARRLFLLGAPLYSVSTTDLFTEHLSRVTRTRMAEHSAAVDGQTYADDVAQLMTRYGWPRWYSRSIPLFGSDQAPSITGHDGARPYNYLPSLRVMEHVGETSADDWRLDEQRALTGYAPAYARSMHVVPGQLARFRRGDSTLVVAAWDARRDTTMLGRDLDVALVIVPASGPLAIARASNVKTTGHISVTGLVDSGLVSLELLARDDRRASRARVGIVMQPRGSIALSDLLLYSAATTTPNDLDAVEDSALASTVVPATRAVGVFWETYGLPRQGEPVQYTLTVEEINVGFLRRVAQHLRFADPASALRIQWKEVPQPRDGIASRGVRVDLSRLHSGQYHMQLTLTSEGKSVVASRTVEIR
jgi:hypothetical protein